MLLNCKNLKGISGGKTWGESTIQRFLSRFSHNADDDCEKADAGFGESLEKWRTNEKVQWVAESGSGG